MELAGAVVLVTGATSGIGDRTARRLADRGARLLVHGRDELQGHRLAHELGATFLAADLAEPAGQRRLAREAETAYGTIDAVVLNAGIGWSGPFDAMSEASAREVLEVDLVAPIALTRLLLPAMVDRGSGHLVLVGSIAGHTAVAGESVYAAAKAGLSVFADSLRYECAGTGITVGTVIPGVVATSFFDRRGRAYDRGYPRPVDPDVVAARVVRALEDERDEQYVPRWLRIAPVVRALAPRTYRRLATRFGEHVRLGDGAR